VPRLGPPHNPIARPSVQLAMRLSNGTWILVVLLIAACDTGTTQASTPSAATAPISSPTKISLPTFAQFSAPSATVVWGLIAGRVLFRSTDRGDKWEQRPTPAGAINAEISFVDDRTGWISSVGPPGTQCSTQGVTIWHTTDAGASWQQVNASGIAQAQCKRGLSFSDSVHGFLTGWDPNHAPVVFRTEDSGRTWRSAHALPDPPGFTTGAGGFTLTPGRVSSFGSTQLVAGTGSSSSGGGNPHTYVFRSTDGGANWTFAARASDTANYVAFVTALRWVQLVQPNGSEETLDGGATWHSFVTDYSQAAPVAPDVVFGGPQIGYATVRGGLHRTSDGGAHWSGLPTPGT
jgi:photosystem II stability/assembly factor-like uncharacterized protein